MPVENNRKQSDVLIDQEEKTWDMTQQDYELVLQSISIAETVLACGENDAAYNMFNDAASLVCKMQCHTHEMQEKWNDLLRLLVRGYTDVAKKLDDSLAIQAYNQAITFSNDLPRTLDDNERNIFISYSYLTDIFADQKDWKNLLSNCNKAFEAFNSISSKNEEDYRDLAHIFYKCANAYFGIGRHQDSIKYYGRAIQQLGVISCQTKFDKESYEKFSMAFSSALDKARVVADMTLGFLQRKPLEKSEIVQADEKRNTP